MIRRVTAGVSRTVFLVGRFAVKVPSGRWGVEFFLKGLLANLREREVWRQQYAPDLALCPVLWCAPLGLVLVMPRCRILEEGELSDHDLADYAWWAELKSDSFGYLPDGRLVAVDYGN